MQTHLPAADVGRRGLEWVLTWPNTVPDGGGGGRSSRQQNALPVRNFPEHRQSVATARRPRHPRPGAPPTLVRTVLAALAGTHRAPGACAAAPPPTADPDAAFPAPEQWFRGPAPGSLKANAAGRSRQRSARHPRQQAAGGSRALREPPLPSRAPGGRTAARRGPHASRATRQANMALRSPRVENSEAPAAARQLLQRHRAA